MTQKLKVDARGSFCPGPLMELVKTIKEQPQGTIIDLLSSDEGSLVDIPKWVEKANHKMIEIIEEDGFRHFVVEVGEKKSRRRRK